MREPHVEPGRVARSPYTLALAAMVAVPAALVGATPGVSAAAVPGILAVFAGTGTAGVPTPGGAATNSNLDSPEGVAVDGAGNVYIADTHNHEIEKVTPAGVLSVIAGTGTDGPPTAGPATSSDLNYPNGVAVDGAGNVYIADTFNNQIEKVTPAGSLSVIAGTGTAGSPIAGPATSSHLHFPNGVAVDGAGNVYIADTNNSEIEKVTPAGSLSVIAGTGIPAAPTAGPATSSNLHFPNGVTVDGAGNVYIADSSNSQIER
jgi:sugar lactone lactonase YvrE